jgi:hypothetical protein
MYYYFNIESQVRRIIKNLSLLDSTTFQFSTDPNVLNDFKDGKLYKRLIESDIGDKIKSQRAFTMTINTDGISSYRYSKLSIWPIFLSINEIPIDKRFCVENVVVAGFSVGEAKPDVNHFFHPIVKELKRLEYGFEMRKLDKTAVSVSIHLLAGVFDKPAKAGVLNMVQFNGFYGCTISVISAANTITSFISTLSTTHAAVLSTKHAALSTKYAAKLLSTQHSSKLSTKRAAKLSSINEPAAVYEFGYISWNGRVSQTSTSEYDHVRSCLSTAGLTRSICSSEI